LYVFIVSPSALHVQAVVVGLMLRKCVTSEQAMRCAVSKLRPKPNSISFRTDHVINRTFRPHDGETTTPSRKVGHQSPSDAAQIPAAYSALRIAASYLGGSQSRRQYKDIHCRGTNLVAGCEI